MSLSAVSWWEPTVKCHGSTGAGCLRTGAKHKQRNCLSEMRWKHGFVLIHLKSRTILQSLYTTKFTNPWRKTEGNWLFLFFFSLSSNCFVLSVCEGAGKQTHLFHFHYFSIRFSSIFSTTSVNSSLLDWSLSHWRSLNRSFHFTLQIAPIKLVLLLFLL